MEPCWIQGLRFQVGSSLAKPASWPGQVTVEAIYPVTADEIAAEAGGFMQLLRDKWYVDELYGVIIIRPLRWVSEVALGRVVDDWIIHGFLVQVVGGAMWKIIGFVLTFWQTGRIGTYAFGMVLGTIFMLWILL